MATDRRHFAEDCERPMDARPHPHPDYERFRAELAAPRQTTVPVRLLPPFVSAGRAPMLGAGIAAFTEPPPTALPAVREWLGGLPSVQRQICAATAAAFGAARWLQWCADHPISERLAVAPARVVADFEAWLRGEVDADDFADCRRAFRQQIDREMAAFSPADAWVDVGYQQIRPLTTPGSVVLEFGLALAQFLAEPHATRTAAILSHWAARLEARLLADDNADQSAIEMRFFARWWHRCRARLAFADAMRAELE